MKKEVAGSSKTLVPLCHTQCHIPVPINLHTYFIFVPCTYEQNITTVCQSKWMNAPPFLKPVNVTVRTWVVILRAVSKTQTCLSMKMWVVQHIPTGGLFVGGFTKTCTSAEEDCPEVSVTFRMNVYIPSSKFDSWRYGVRVFYNEWINFITCFC